MAAILAKTEEYKQDLVTKKKQIEEVNASKGSPVEGGE
jgi:hypothetical protein